MAQTFSAREETTSLDSAIYTLPRVAQNGRYHINLLRDGGRLPGSIGTGVRTLEKTAASRFVIRQRVISQLIARVP
jgi:hypothetical protein